MSKFNTLWERIDQDGRAVFSLSFSDIKTLAGIDIDHSFLNAKKELLSFGYQVKKISLKDQTVVFEKIKP